MNSLLDDHLNKLHQTILSAGYASNEYNNKLSHVGKIFHVPEGTAVIEESQYEGLEGYDKIVFPESVRFVSKKAFYNCSAYVFEFNEGLTVIEELAFATDQASKSKLLPDLPSSLMIVHQDSFGLVLPEDMPGRMLLDFIWPLDNLRYESLKQMNLQKQEGCYVSSDLMSLLVVGVFDAQLPLEERVERYVKLLAMSAALKCSSRTLEGCKLLFRPEESEVTNISPIGLMLNYLNFGFLPEILDIGYMQEIAGVQKGIFEKLDLELYTLMHRDCNPQDYMADYLIRKDGFKDNSHSMLFSNSKNKHNLLLGLGFYTDELAFELKKDMLEKLLQLDFDNIQGTRVNSKRQEENVPSVEKVLVELYADTELGERLPSRDFFVNSEQGRILQSKVFDFIMINKCPKSMRMLIDILDSIKALLKPEYIDIFPRVEAEFAFFDLMVAAQVDIRYLRDFLDEYYDVIDDPRSFSVMRQIGAIPNWGVEKYVLLDKVIKLKSALVYMRDDAGQFSLEKAVNFINERVEMLGGHLNFMIGLGEVVDTEQEMWTLFANKHKDILPRKVYESFINGDSIISEIIQDEVDKTLSAVKLAWACGVWYYRNSKYNTQAFEEFKRIVVVKNMENLFSSISMVDVTSPAISGMFIEVCELESAIAAKAYNFYRAARKKYKQNLKEIQRLKNRKAITEDELELLDELQISVATGFGNKYLRTYVGGVKNFFKFEALEREFARVGYSPEQTTVTWLESIYEIALGILESCGGDYSKIKHFVQTEDTLEEIDGNVLYCLGRLDDVRMYPLKETCDTCNPKAMQECSLLHPECQTILFVDYTGWVIGKISGHIDIVSGEILFNTFEFKGNASISEELAQKIWDAFDRAMKQQVKGQAALGVTITKIAVAGTNSDLQKLLERLSADENSKVRHAGVEVEPYTYVSYFDARKTYVGDVASLQFIVYDINQTKLEGVKVS